MNKSRRLMLGLTTFALVSFYSASVLGQTYVQSWDAWTTSTVNRFWQNLLTVRFSTSDLARLKTTTARVIAHGDSYNQCLVPTNLAITHRQGENFEIIICARQIRFMLHFMDAFTTIAFDSAVQQDAFTQVLNRGDKKEIEAFLRPSLEFYQQYEDYVISNLWKEMNHAYRGDELIAYQCGPDYFKMLRDQRRDFTHCTHSQELNGQSEFNEWYYSLSGPGGRFAESIKHSTGQLLTPKDVKMAWNAMHEEVNKIAVYFVILHEVGHILNGDLERRAKVDAADRSDAAAEATADLWAMKMSDIRGTTKVPMLTALVAGMVVMYVRYMYEEGPETPSEITSDTRARMNSLDDYQSAMAVLPSGSKQEAEMKQRMLELLRIK